ncbi:hypothetical protein BDV95DRAFT_246344 [Massariosphaeria phaeospora]|uniref:Uncharacterized protein n=1 Tax=Massariosphaeria phaeospora TaxID=100035 RepID=A0A7C8HZ17_9PLEO|nr:hypothetical protein BDV95DRAFT_246344 [Massariosphaeria phaeospora]
MGYLRVFDYFCCCFCTLLVSLMIISLLHLKSSQRTYLDNVLAVSLSKLMSLVESDISRHSHLDVSVCGVMSTIFWSQFFGFGRVTYRVMVASM